jgi:hypothetical protein
LARAAREARQPRQPGAGREPQAGEGAEGEPGSEPGEPSGQPGQPGKGGAPKGEGIAGGDPGIVDVAQLDSAVQKATGRRWGELPKNLQTEILQAASKRPNSEYAPLIKLYFKEIAKARKAER